MIPSPRRLVVCCDGTWNTAIDDTNVAAPLRRLATADDQLPRYFPGVGTDGGPVRRVLDGAFGTGLGEHVREVYRWLAETFRPGDELVLLGFSRGAFTVRSTVGMLAQCGLVAFGPEQDDAARTRSSSASSPRATGRRATCPAPGSPSTPASAPTTRPPSRSSACGTRSARWAIPRTFGLLSGLTGRAGVAFHDLELAPDVRHARQGLALDERRGPYVPSVWPTPPAGRHASFAQVWFPGGHGDVGGGKPETGLSDGALRWMVEELDATVAPALARGRATAAAGPAVRGRSTTASTACGAC